jgi:hypothetical protein
MLEKVLEILRVLEKISKGENVDFTESFADLVGLKDQLGRRQEDRQLGEALCTVIGSIATNLVGAEDDRGETPDGVLRKVKLTRVSGGKGKPQPAIVGWEEHPPRVGQIYRVFQENGSVVRTSPITRFAGGYVQTRNSLYQIEVVEEKDEGK